MITRNIPGHGPAEIPSDEGEAPAVIALDVRQFGSVYAPTGYTRVVREKHDKDREKEMFDRYDDGMDAEDASAAPNFFGRPGNSAKDQIPQKGNRPRQK